jgi:SAM-dependent methyltransferase
LVLAGLQVKGKRVLDLGCGAGRLAEVLAKMNARAVLACDLSYAMVEAASSLGAPDCVFYIVCNGKKLPLPDQSIDVAFALGTLEATEDIVPFAREIRRVMCPDATFLFTVWNRNRWYRLGFLDGRRRGSIDHDANELRRVLEANAFDHVNIRSTLFLPRGFFWAGYRCSRLLLLDGIFVWICNVAASFLRELKLTKKRGWVLLVSAKAAVE